MFVAGYPSTHADIDEVVDAAAWAVDNGFKLIKIARSNDADVTVSALRDIVRVTSSKAKIVVDASWVWSRADQALREIATWPLDDIAWLEDPFAPEMIGAFERLRRHSCVRVGAGDEVTDQGTLGRLVNDGGVDILRLDVATIGGISSAVRVLHAAELWGVPISTHISTEVSAHLAGAFPIIDSIETFDVRGNRFDPSNELYVGTQSFKDGLCHLDSAPGIGMVPVQPI